MKRVALVCGVLVAFLTAQLGQICAEELEEGEAQEIAAAAYIYGYPLVTMEMTRRVMTNTAKSGGGRAPMGQFANARYYPTADFHDVTAPNADTLYSTAWLDVSKEPYVLTLPEEKSRYYLMPMLTGWTDVFSDLGTRTTGTGPQKYVIYGPGWRGQLPSGLTELRSPTNLVWILGRTYCSGTKEDYEAVHAIQDQYSLVPLSQYGKSYDPPLQAVDASIDMQTPVRRQVNEMEIEEYLALLMFLMRDNPPAAFDRPLLESIKKIGLEPGKDFDMSRLPPQIAYEVESAKELALREIELATSEVAPRINGWEMSLDLGRYGNNYLKRAVVAAIGLGANLPQDAIYPIARVDGEGKTLKGNNCYVLHFEKDEIPPVKGFWSLTLYSDQYFFVNNAQDRYTLSPRNALKYNPDGSLDLYVQYNSPGPDKESNWLPAPEEDFVLMLRLYWPDQKVLKGLWQPPKVQKVKVPLKDRIYQDLAG